MTLRQTQAASYWTDNFVVENYDLEFLNNLLLEAESPLTTDELVLALIKSRIEREARALQQRSDGAKVKVHCTLQFSLHWFADVVPAGEAC